MGGAQIFSLSPRISAWAAHCSSPPQNQGRYRDWGLPEIHLTEAELPGPQSFPNPSGVGIANTVVKGIRLLWFQPGMCPICGFNLTEWHLKTASG